MTDKEKLEREIEPLIKEGLIRNILTTNEMEVFALCENCYTAAMYGDVFEKNGMNYFARLTHEEFGDLMVEPTANNLKNIVAKGIKDGKNNIYVFTPEMIEKFRIISKKVAANPAYQIKRSEEVFAVKCAQEYLKANNIEQSAPGMGGR